MEFQSHKCRACGEQFIVACLSQLQEKLKTHCCKSRTVVNKKMEKSQQLQQKGIALFVHDTVVNRIEQLNFDRLVKQGVFVHG